MEIKWYNVKHYLPPFNWYVECLLKKDNMLTDLDRIHAAYFYDQDEISS